MAKEKKKLFPMETFFNLKGKSQSSPLSIIKVTKLKLSSTSETKLCYSRATVEPAWHGNSTTFEAGLTVFWDF